MSNDMVERMVDRVAGGIIAGLSDEQKSNAVEQVMTNLQAKAKSKSKSKKKTNKKDKKEDKEEKPKGNAKKKTPKKKTPKKKTKKEESKDGPEEKVEETEEVAEEKAEATDDTSEMSDDGMGAMDALSAEIEKIKQDGKIESAEVVSLLQSMMGMVDSLLRAKPGRKVKASVEDRVACTYLISAARGLQVKRKDKDLMSDTGGTSKGRNREPEQKPPREDMKKNNRTKNKPSGDRDSDTDKDKDLKASIHPLDRKAEALWGLEMPEENYYRRVWSSLTGILANTKGVSEKDHAGYDEIMTTADQFLREPKAMEVVDRFESQNKRPEFCAECLYSDMR